MSVMIKNVDFISGPNIFNSVYFLDSTERDGLFRNNKINTLDNM